MFVLLWDITQLTVCVGACECFCMWDRKIVCVCTWATVCLCSVCVCDKWSLLSLHISKDLAQDLCHSWICRLFLGVCLTSFFRHSWIHKTLQRGSDPLSRLSLVSLWACWENHDSHTKSWFITGVDNINLEVPLFPQDVQWAFNPVKNRLCFRERKDDLNGHLILYKHNVLFCICNDWNLKYLTSTHKKRIVSELTFTILIWHKTYRMSNV